MTFLRSVARGLGWEDVIGLTGLCCLVYGVSQWSVPLAWVLVGSLQVAAAMWPAIRRRRR